METRTNLVDDPHRLSLDVLARLERLLELLLNRLVQRLGRSDGDLDLSLVVLDESGELPDDLGGGGQSAVGGESIEEVGGDLWERRRGCERVCVEEEVWVRCLGLRMEMMVSMEGLHMNVSW
jgi:hypothetical protein